MNRIANYVKEHKWDIVFWIVFAIVFIYVFVFYQGVLLAINRVLRYIEYIFIIGTLSIGGGLLIWDYLRKKDEVPDEDIQIKKEEEN